MVRGADPDSIDSTDPRLDEILPPIPTNPLEQNVQVLWAELIHDEQPQNIGSVPLNIPTQVQQSDDSLETKEILPEIVCLPAQASQDSEPSSHSPAQNTIKFDSKLFESVFCNTSRIRIGSTLRAQTLLTAGHKHKKHPIHPLLRPTNSSKSNKLYVFDCCIPRRRRKWSISSANSSISMATVTEDEFLIVAQQPDPQESHNSAEMLTSTSFLYMEEEELPAHVTTSFETETTLDYSESSSETGTVLRGTPSMLD